MKETKQDQNKPYNYHQPDQYPNQGGNPNDLFKKLKEVEKK